MRSARWLAFVAGLIALLSAPAAALQRNPFPLPTDFSLRIIDDQGRSHYYLITEAGDRMWFGQFKRIAGWHMPASQPKDVTRVQLACRREGDRIRIDLSVGFLPLPSGPVFMTAPAEGYPGQALGSYTAGLGETVSLDALADFGIVPIEVKVVPSKAHSLDPARVANRTRAIEVVRVDRARNLFRIVLRNTSAKPVAALQLYYPVTQGPYGQVIGSGTNKIISPGEVYETQFQVSVRGRMTPQGFVQDDSVTPKVAIGGVVFDDLTYEGDKEVMLKVAANLRGEMMQAPRILSLIKPALDVADSRALRERLERQMAALSLYVDGRVVENRAGRYGPLTPPQRNFLAGELQNGLRAKDDIAFMIKYFDRVQPFLKMTFHQYLNSVKDCYEALLKHPL